MVNSTDLCKNLKMNQQDLDNIIELQKESNSRADNILFISVICQALLDATRPKVSNERTSITFIREEATAWFFASIGVTRQNFEFICDYAGLNPTKVRDFASYVINSDNKEEVRSKLNLILKRKRNEQASKRN